MQIIKKLSKQIKDELHDAEKYAELAIEHKAEHPTLSSVYYRLANAELDHVNMLHGEVVDLINKAKGEKAVPPVMFEFWAWQHDEMIEEEKEVRMLLEMYKSK